MSVPRGTLHGLLAGVLVVGLCLMSWLGAESPPLAGWRANVLVLLHVVSPALAAALCLATSRRAVGGPDRAGWLLLGLAAATWAAASTTFAWYQFRVGTPPYPAVWDLLWISYALPALAGLVVFTWSVPHAVSRAHTIVDGLVVAAGMLVIAWHVLLADLLTAPGNHTLAWWTTVGYLVADTSVAALVLSVAGQLVRARLSLGLVGLGLLLVAVCDVSYVRAGMTETLVMGEQVWQAGYTVGFLLVGVAAVTFVSTSTSTSTSTSSETETTSRPTRSLTSRWPGVASQVAVYTVLSAAVLLTAAGTISWRSTPALVVMSLVTLALALLRA